MTIIERMQAVCGCDIVNEIIRTLPDPPETKAMGVLFRENDNTKSCDVALYPEVLLDLGFYDMGPAVEYYLISLPQQPDVQELTIIKKQTPAAEGVYRLPAGEWKQDYLFYPTRDFINYVRAHVTEIQ